MLKVYSVPNFDLNVTQAIVKNDPGDPVRITGPSHVRVYLNPLGSLATAVFRLRYRMHPDLPWVDFSPIVQIDANALYTRFPVFVCSAPEIAMQCVTPEGSSLFGDWVYAVDPIGGGP